MPCLRQISATGKPDSPSPKMPTIWLSVNFDFRISHLQRNGNLYFQLVHRLGKLTKVHLLQAPALFLEFFHARHHGNIHAAVFSPLFVKHRCADAKLAANIWNAQASLNASDRVHDLAITEFISLNIEPLPLEKILLLTSLVIRDDYPL